MPFVAAAGIARVSIDYISAQADRGTNVFHVRNVAGAAWDAGSLDDMTFIIEAWLNNSWDVVAAEAWQADLITALSLDEEEGLIRTRVSTATGLITSEPLPSQDTVALSFRTGFSGRSRRGRNYHVGLTENSTTGSYINSTAIANLITAYQQLITDLANDDFALGVLSYVSDGAPRVTPLFTPYVNVIITDTVVDSMDTRKPRPA